MALVGPTATGKSALALDVARALGDVEIVTADSMQVYRGMDIGTAKPSPAERAEVPHHLIDLVSPDEDFTLRRFQRAAREAVADIEDRGRRPLLVGGTGLYVRAIVDDLDIPGRFPHVRAALEARDDLEGMYEELRSLDPLAARRIEPGNRRRIVRALEVVHGSNRPFSSYGTGLEDYPATDWDLVAVEMERDELSRRIRARFEDQLARGLLDEVRALRDHRPPLGRTAGQALGYRQLLDHLAGRCTLEEAVEAAISATRRFARRQRAWFRRDPRMSWLPANTDGQRERLADDLVARWESRGSDLGVDMRDSKA